ncbi:MAG: class I tRNA ligase family protein [Planctomycetaceae bacterium]
MDRWILSRLQELIGTAHDSFRAYDVARLSWRRRRYYIDDLSNWYIRRNRRRFWRSKDASDSDKTAAYQTLHEVLLTPCKLLAPSIPFLAERMYQNLASGGRQSPVTQDEAGAGEVDGALNKQGVDTPRSPGSVHLCDYPTVDESKLDPALNRKTAAVQTLVRLAHRLRETAELRVRQPLAELQFAANDAEIAAALEQSADIIADELNVKTGSPGRSTLMSWSAMPASQT